MTVYPGSLVRKVQASTPSAQGGRSSKADVSRTLDLSGIGGGITPIRGRRSTLASISVGTPLESPVVVGFREVNDENNCFEDAAGASQAQPQPETTICYTPMGGGKGRAAGTSGWNVNSPLPPRSNNLGKRRCASRETEGGSDF
ncbi:MAG: hypothetical protein BJ554DRAFT_5113 [Olpidium bornovanus]|uniref:Uncharacterized protein n=1 Tax=Olpidium bornovanus TaxID=278681 RepID=A0A8H8DE56_9FUNG|nr:MAG: hypothetical protein BJ554DRAFT_5113 [Olpidium bornovanus]